MTNAEIVAQALMKLGTGWHTSREIMWQVRRDGYQMTTARARGIARVLHRQGKAHMLVDGKRYSFEITAEYRDTHSSDQWEIATKDLPREPAFSVQR